MKFCLETILYSLAISILSLPVLAQSQPDLGEGLVLHYAFGQEKDPIDLSGNSNHGMAFSGATWSNFGQEGYGFFFDGEDDGIAVCDGPDFEITDNLTLAAWVYMSQMLGRQSQIIFRGDNRCGLDPYCLYVTKEGEFKFFVQQQDDTSECVTTPAITGRWVHVCGTLDGASGALTLYLDGKEVATKTTTVRPFAQLSEKEHPGVGIGNHGGFPFSEHNQPFPGNLDEVRIYNRTVSVEEVQALARKDTTATDDDSQSEIYHSAQGE